MEPFSSDFYWSSIVELFAKTFDEYLLHTGHLTMTDLREKGLPLGRFIDDPIVIRFAATTNFVADVKSHVYRVWQSA